MSNELDASGIASRDRAVDDLLDTYLMHNPAGEIVLEYNPPAGTTFMPIGEGRLGNVSQFLLQGRGLWVYSFISTFFLLHACMLFSLRSPALPHRHGLEHSSRLVHTPMADTFYQIPLRFIESMAILFSFLLGLYAICIGIYVVTVVLNMFFKFGGQFIKRLAAPTNVSFSQLCMKFFWSGRFVSHHGAMLDWQDVLSVDLRQPEEIMEAPAVLIKYKFCREMDLPFSLAGFNTPREARFFLEMIERNVRDEVKTERFLQACQEKDSLVCRAWQTVPDVLLAEVTASSCSEGDRLQQADSSVQAAVRCVGESLATHEALTELLREASLADRQGAEENSSSQQACTEVGYTEILQIHEPEHDVEHVPSNVVHR